MVKGVSRRVIMVKSPDPKIFEEAIFIVKEDVLKKGGTSARDVLREAQRVANEYVKSNMHQKTSRFPRIPAPIFAIVGAVLTGLIFLLANLI